MSEPIEVYGVYDWGIFELGRLREGKFGVYTVLKAIPTKITFICITHQEGRVRSVEFAIEENILVPINLHCEILPFHVISFQ